MVPTSIAGILAALSAVILGAFMSILDATIVNVALPTFGRVFETSLQSLQWIITGYMLASAAVIPHLGLAQRPLRLQEGVPDRAGAVHGRLRALRHGDHRADADPLPRPPGARRRHADAGRHGDPVPPLAAGQARRRDGHLRHPDAARAGPRPVISGWLLESASWPLDLPDQRAGRNRGGDRRAPVAPEPGRRAHRCPARHTRAWCWDRWRSPR